MFEQINNQAESGANNFVEASQHDQGENKSRLKKKILFIFLALIGVCLLVIMSWFVFSKIKKIDNSKN